MGLSLYRIIEVKRESISGTFENYEELCNHAKEGKLYIDNVYKLYGWNIENKYRTYKGLSETGEPIFEESDKCEYHWEIPEIYNNFDKHKYCGIDEPDVITNNNIKLRKFTVDEICTSFKNNFRGYTGDSFEFSNRGLPEDISKEANYIINDWQGYNHTYLTIEDLNSHYCKVYNNWKQNIINKLIEEKNTNIDLKLNYIIDALKDPFNISLKKEWENKTDEDEEYYEDTLEYIFNEEYWEIESINSEIDILRFVAELAVGILGEHGIRAIYWVSC